MSKLLVTKTVVTSLFYCILLSITTADLKAQQLNINDFVLFSGPNGTGTTLIGSSITINGGSVGAKKLVQSTGNVAINSNIYSKDKIILSNSNIVKGNIAAGANYLNPPISTGTILSVGSSASITGNIDVYGNINIGGGSVTGKVTLPTGYTYIGPPPSNDTVFSTPAIPVLPDIPGKTNLGIYPVVTSNEPIPFSQGPGNYGNIILTGNKTMTLNEPGIYIFNSIKMTGNSNKLVFNFNNKPGNFKIFIRHNADFGKLNASLALNKGGSADRIQFEIQGNGQGLGANSSLPGFSFVIANGSSSGGSKWLGSVLAVDGGINIGSGTGSSTLTGTFASLTGVSIQSGVTIFYSPFNYCARPVVKATSDRPLNFIGQTTLTDSFPSPGVSRLWRATNGGIISSNDLTAQTITVSAAGTYIVTDSISETCLARDTVIVSAKVKNIIGAELLSIYLHYNPNNPNPDIDSFFVTDNGYVTIDIFCIVDTAIVIDRLTDNDGGADPVVYGLTNVIPNGLSPHTVTGDILVTNLIKLNDLSDILKFCRPYYKPSTNAGITISQGDTTMRTYLIRKGFELDGSGVKIGVISDSYKTITDPSTTYFDVCNDLNQNLIVNDESAGTANGDLSNVTLVQDFPIKLTDEGRAMMEIINDVAPGSQKYFFTGFYTAGYMADAIDSLAKLGCKIIVDDVSYATEPMLKDGIIAKTVNRVKQDSSVLYFSSAGNFGNKSYEKNFNPVLAGNISGFETKYAHNFKTGDNSNPDFFQKVWLRPGSNMIVFQWLDDIYSIDDPGGTKYDMDFYLTPADNTDGTGLIGFNRDNLGGDPIEFIPIRIPGNNDCDTVARAYNIFIVNNTPGGNPARIKYVAFRGNFRVDEYYEGYSTLVGQANAEGAIAVGASRFNHVPGHPLLPSTMSTITKPQIESYSSIGGTIARLKPDLVGPDGINTSTLMGQDYPPQALDRFSNFFGTSAAAPHAAAMAALLIQGRQKYLGKTSHPVDSLKLLMQVSAVDMRPASMGSNDYNFFTKTGTYDYISGAGMVNGDSAMRTFASPKPFEIKLVKPTDVNIIPCQDPFTLTIVGENFSLNSVVYLDTNRVEPIEPDSSIRIPYSYISRNRDTIKVTINSCVGNPFIWVNTDATPGLIVPDGGLSNGIKLFSKEIEVFTLDTAKFYGDVNPTPRTVVKIGDLIITNQTTPNLADIGLDASKLNLIETIADTYTNVGTYSIKVYRQFSSANAQDRDLTNQYRYFFRNGLLTINKLPITVKPDDKTIVSGHAVGNITYTYKYENGATVTNPILLHKFDSSYKVYKPDNTIAIINNYPGATGLNDDALDNISGMVTFNALKNSRKYQVVNGYLTPLPANSTLFNIQYLVDVSAQSLLNFKNNPASAVMVPVGYPGIHSRAIVGAAKLAAGEINISTSINPLGQMINGLLVKSVNTSVGSLVPIYSNNLMQMVDGVQITINNGDTSAIANESLVQVANGLLVKSVNGELVPIANNVLVKLLDNTIVYQTSNALLVKSVNGTSEPVLNGLLVKSVNGVLVKSVNGIDVPVADGTLIQLANGLLVKSVNGASSLIQMANGVQLPVADGLQVVNGLLVKSVNGTDVPITSGLIGVVDGNIVQIVNSFSISQGNNEDAAVIIDSDDIDVEHGFLGAMFSTDMITGLAIGDHSIIAGTLINRNLQLTYEVGRGTVIEDPACLQTHSPFKNFGNTSPDPTSLWLNLTTKVSGQLSSVGDYLLFKKGTVTLNAISWTPPVNYNDSIPNGKIIAVNVPPETPPVTHYDAATNTWITEVPVNFASTSDIFVTGKIINSSNGFVKLNGNTSTVVKGAFYSNRTFSDQWTYGIAAYQPQFDYPTIMGEGQVVSINGNQYRAGTPLVNNVPLQFLVQGASGGGGQNYTGSSASFQAFTACIDLNPLPEEPSIRIVNSSLTLEADQTEPSGPGVLINPNPASGYITVSFVPVQTGRSKIEIFTINGRKVFEADYGICEAENKYIKQIDVNKLINGIYLIRVWNAGKVTNKKIVIAH